MTSQSARKSSPISLLKALASKQRARANSERPSRTASRAQHSQAEKERQKTKSRRERIGASGNISNRRALHRMNQPDGRSEEGNKAAAARLHFAKTQQLFGKEEERDRRRAVPENADEMITRRRENKGRVIEQISQPLQRPIKIRRRPHP